MKGQTAIGTRRHMVTLTGPGASVPDGDGGFTQARVDLDPPTWYCSIEPATARDLERVTAGTVIATASHVLKGRYHSGITTNTVVTFGTRTFHVSGVANLEERSIETVAIAVEVLTPVVAGVDTSWAQSGWAQ